MANIVFPENPNINDEYTFNNVTFYWNGNRWRIKGVVVGGGSGGTSDFVPPAIYPEVYDDEPANLPTYTYIGSVSYNDGSSPDLEEVSIEIEFNNTLAILTIDRTSGAGKYTLISGSFVLNTIYTYLDTENNKIEIFVLNTQERNKFSAYSKYKDYVTLNPSADYPYTVPETLDPFDFVEVAVNEVVYNGDLIDLISTFINTFNSTSLYFEENIRIVNETNMGN